MVESATSDGSFSSSSTLLFADWEDPHLYTFTFDGSASPKINLYRDQTNITASEGSIPSSIPDSSNLVRAGGVNVDTYDWMGYIYEFIVADKLWTPTQIAKAARLAGLG